MKNRRKERLERRRAHIREELAEIREAKRFIRTGKKSQMYTIGSRQNTRYQMSLPQLDAEEKALRDELDELEDVLDGYGARMSIRTIYNDRY